MKTENFRQYPRNNGRHMLLLPLVFLFVLLIVSTQIAISGDSYRYHKVGELTNLESSSNAIIDEKGYLIDSNAVIVNAADKQISPDKLSFPTRVIFEYTYMQTAPRTMSPVIVYIKEIKNTNSGKRSMQ